MLEIVIEARNAAISKSMNVKRILPFRLRRMVGPFIFMDHAGPVLDIPSEPSSLDVLPHPHIGLSTISYLFGGHVTHRDSLGVEQIIRPGEVNWMTAGKGIAHSERFEDPAAMAGGDQMRDPWLIVDGIVSVAVLIGAVVFVAFEVPKGTSLSNATLRFDPWDGSSVVVSLKGVPFGTSNAINPDLVC